jgi:hypothetical protein
MCADKSLHIRGFEEPALVGGDPGSTSGARLVGRLAWDLVKPSAPLVHDVCARLGRFY